MARTYRHKLRDVEVFFSETNYYILLTSLEDLLSIGKVNSTELLEDYKKRCELFNVYNGDPSSTLLAAGTREYIRGETNDLQITERGKELIENSQVGNVLKFDKKKL